MRKRVLATLACALVAACGGERPGPTAPFEALSSPRAAALGTADGTQIGVDVPATAGGTARRVGTNCPQHVGCTDPVSVGRLLNRASVDVFVTGSISVPADLSTSPPTFKDVAPLGVTNDFGLGVCDRCLRPDCNRYVVVIKVRDADRWECADEIPGTSLVLPAGEVLAAINGDPFYQSIYKGSFQVRVRGPFEGSSSRHETGATGS